jgi:hypothetical protein
MPRVGGGNQFYFPFSRQSFDLILATHRFVFAGEGPGPGKHYGQAGTGVFGAFAAVVCFDATVQIIGPPGVEGSVSTFQYVGMKHRTPQVVSLL